MKEKSDPKLGEKIQSRLIELGIETPMIDKESIAPTIKDIEPLFRDIMVCLGLDMSDDSLKDTPKRIQNMFYNELFYGLDYNNFPKNTTILNKFKADEMICVRDITVHSCCEHHFVPIVGKAHVAYIPKKRVVGLSKINRIVDFFCRRPQVQERLTEQISAALEFLLETDDIAVIIDAQHLCVRIRGVEDAQSSTATSKMRGRFRNVPELRQEFLNLK